MSGVLNNMTQNLKMNDTYYFEFFSIAILPSTNQILFFIFVNNKLAVPAAV